MDATPKDGSVMIYETALCKNCGQGISRAPGATKWEHNTFKTQCGASKDSAPRVEVEHTGDRAYIHPVSFENVAEG